jgi:hypothetical protein
VVAGVVVAGGCLLRGAALDMRRCFRFFKLLVLLLLLLVSCVMFVVL